jgi:hypothetical protein
MSPDIHELFDDAADDSGRKPLDATRLVAKGRRKVRIRQYGVLSGAVVLVAAAVLGLGELRTLSSNGPGPIPPAYTPTVPVPVTPTPTVPFPTTPTSTTKAATVTPTGKATTVVPTGKAITVVPTGKTTTLPVPTTGGTSRRTRTPATGTELIRLIPHADAVQRCRQRMEVEHGEPGTVDERPGVRPSGDYVTDLLFMKLKDGSRAYCSVPGETRPDSRGPSPDPRSLCGELAWLDLTNWSVTSQADGQGGFAAALISPDRKAVLLCDQDGPGVRRSTIPFPHAFVQLVFGPASGEVRKPEIHLLGAVKNGRQFWGGGGIAKAGAVRYALFADSRKLSEVPVRNGLYAMRVWLPAGIDRPTQVRAYNEAGTVIEQYTPF